MTRPVRSENLRGIGFMVLAMAGFALEDTFIKLAEGSMALGPVIVCFGLGGTAVFALLARRRGDPILTAAALSRPILLRAGFEIAGRIGYFLAIVLTPLSSASAILQATPLVVTLGAALFLGEAVGWRRWTAILVGFAGVLVILRPGLDGFALASLWTVLGVVGLAGRDLATRAAPRGLSNVVLAVYGFAILIPTGLGMTLFTGLGGLPGPGAAACVLAATAAGIVGYYGITAAMRLGEVGVVTPFRYVRLLFALVLGVAVFGERPDAATLAGAALVVATGLYTILRERGARAAPAVSARTGFASPTGPAIRDREPSGGPQ